MYSMVLCAVTSYSLLYGCSGFGEHAAAIFRVDAGSMFHRPDCAVRKFIRPESLLRRNSDTCFHTCLSYTMDCSVQVLTCACSETGRLENCSNNNINNNNNNNIFILANQLSSGDLPVNPDHNNRSQHLPNIMHCLVAWSSVTLWPTGDLGATDGSDQIPS
jgi:hypothetical protein